METVKKYSREQVGALVRRYSLGQTDGSEVHALALGLQKETPGLSYADAVSQIMRVSAAYDDRRLSDARKKMNDLLADRQQTQQLAGDCVNALAQRHLKRYAQESYRDALSVVARQYPTLWRVYETGRLSDNDFGTLGLMLEHTHTFSAER